MFTHIPFLSAFKVIACIYLAGFLTGYWQLTVNHGIASVLAAVIVLAACLWGCKKIFSWK